jgi:hypothetical protein
MQPKLRTLLEDCGKEYFTTDNATQLLMFIKSNPAFKGEPQLAKELQQISDYVKILVLQFEELYQELPLEDLKEQVQSLKRRLIAGYVKIQKRQLAAEMSATSDEKKLQQMITQVDKLNKLIVGK